MYSQAKVRYRRGYLNARKCAFCTMYRKGSDGTFGRCTAVTGQITPFGVCDIYDRMSDPYGIGNRDHVHPIHLHRVMQPL